jgi:hypothetical protein
MELNTEPERPFKALWQDFPCKRRERCACGDGRDTIVDFNPAKGDTQAGTAKSHSITNIIISGRKRRRVTKAA